MIQKKFLHKHQFEIKQKVLYLEYREGILRFDFLKLNRKAKPFTFFSYFKDWQKYKRYTSFSFLDIRFASFKHRYVLAHLDLVCNETGASWTHHNSLKIFWKKSNFFKILNLLTKVFFRVHAMQHCSIACASKKILTFSWKKRIHLVSLMKLKIYLLTDVITNIFIGWKVARTWKQRPQWFFFYLFLSKEKCINPVKFTENNL